ncbi:MAG: MFS transporter [Bryobacteraceae bacterium]
MQTTGAAPIQSASGSASVWRDPALWFVLAAAFAYGAVFNVLPVMFPAFRSEFGANFEELGRTQLLFFISSLLVSALGGWFIGRAGFRRAAAGSIALLAVGLLTIAAAPRFAAVLAGAFLFGLAISALVVVCNSIVSEHFGERRQSVFSVFGILDAVGAIVGPAVLGWFLGAGRPGAWRGVCAGMAAGLLLLGAWVLFLRPKNGWQAPARFEGASEHMAEIGGILGRLTIYGIGLATFLHGVAQVGMISWVGQFFQKTHGIGSDRAAYFISVNSAGFFAGRSLLTWITSRRPLPELAVLAVSAGGGTIAFLCTVFAPDYWTALACFAVAGFFISGDAPSMNSYTGLRFAGRTATAFALLSGIGNIGGAAGPYVTGLIAARAGIERGIRFIPAFSLALAGLAIVWYLRTSRPAKTS